MLKLIQAVVLAGFLLGGNAWAAKVDINKADSAALIENLEGVGPVKAKAIVDYRKKHGAFKTYDDLMNVPGIGVETVKKNKANLSLKGGAVKASRKTSAASGKKQTSSSTSESKNAMTRGAKSGADSSADKSTAATKTKAKTTAKATEKKKTNKAKKSEKTAAKASTKKAKKTEQSTKKDKSK